MLRAIAMLLLLAATFVFVVVSQSQEAGARAKKQVVLKSCVCMCFSNSSTLFTGNHREFVAEGTSCPSLQAEECSVYSKKTKKWEDGHLSSCKEDPSTQGKPRPNKRWPFRPETKPQPRSDGTP